MTRSEAKSVGLKTYYTGKACKHGHVSERLVSNLTCSECNRLKAKAYSRKFAEENKAKCKTHYRNNKAAYIERAYRRVGKLKQRSFDHERKEIDSIYQKCPPGYEVDHEIPLTHKDVCGLHCRANLQYLPKLENRGKSNHWNKDPQ